MVYSWKKKKFANGDPLGCTCTSPKAQGRALSQVEYVFVEWVTSPEHQVPQHWAYIILSAWTHWNGLSCPRWHLIPATQITCVHVQVLRMFKKQCAGIKKSAYNVHEFKHMENPHYIHHSSILTAVDEFHEFRGPSVLMRNGQQTQPTRWKNKKMLLK